MNRIINTSIATSTLFLAQAQQALAQGPSAVVTVQIKRPPNAIDPSVGLGQVISTLVGFLVVVAVIAALLYIILGAFQWITSGGDKTKVESARNHIIAAVVGLIIIALSFVILNIVTSLLGIGNLTDLKIIGLPSSQ